MKEYDFIIIGAGVTGLSAAMYAARLGMKTLCLGSSSGSELPLGGVITTTNIVENYPGFKIISGDALANKIREQAESYDLVDIKEERADNLSKTDNGFIIKTEKEEYLGKTILFATGTKWRKLEVPGSNEFENRGVVYCALCDAPLFKGKIVAVVGGSDSAVKEALVAAEHASKVYIIYRGREIHPEPINYNRVINNSKIEIVNETNIIEVRGKKNVDSIVLDRKYNGSNELNVNGVFVAIGHIPLSDLAKKIGVKTNDKDEIVIDHKTTQTNIAGVYAAGDVADTEFKQAITGVAEGCTAAYHAHEYMGRNTY